MSIDEFRRLGWKEDGVNTSVEVADRFWHCCFIGIPVSYKIRLIAVGTPVSGCMLDHGHFPRRGRPA
jgi:hypothetical protein